MKEGTLSNSLQSFMGGSLFNCLQTGVCYSCVSSTRVTQHLMFQKFQAIRQKEADMRFLHAGKFAIAHAHRKGIAAEGQKLICNGYEDISASFHQDIYSLLPQAKQQLLEHIVLMLRSLAGLWISSCKIPYRYVCFSHVLQGSITSQIKLCGYKTPCEN